MRLFATLLFAALLLGFAGCFETSRSLSSEDQSKVDPAYCGNWEVADPDHPDQQKVQLCIRNIDDKRYFVEWTNPNEKDDKTLRMVGWTAQVKNVAFAQLRELPADGTIKDTHLVMRIERAGEQLKLRQLDDKFFKDKPLDTDADFKRMIEDNLDNSEMYDEQEIVADKAK